MSNSPNSNMVAVRASRSSSQSINPNSRGRNSANSSRSGRESQGRSHGYDPNIYKRQGSPPDHSVPPQTEIQDFRNFSTGIPRNTIFQRNNGFTRGDPSVLDRFNYTRSVSNNFEAGNGQEEIRDL